MEYTYDDIQAGIDKQIDYESFVDLLQTDLNAIADQIIEEDGADPSTDYINFKVYFDQGAYDTTLEQGAIGEGDGFNVTPVLVKFVNGDYSSARGPQFFTTVFSIEVFGFEKDRTKLRRIFETYSYLNQGRIDNDDPSIYTVKTLEFPVFEDAILWKGSTRFQGFMRLFVTYMYNGQMSNDVIVTLDGETLTTTSLNVARTRTPDSQQRNNEMEVTNVYEAQILTFSGSMIFDNGTAALALLNNIKSLNLGLNTQFTLAITYPAISDTPDTYKVYLDNGTIAIDEGGVITLSFVLVLAEV